MHTTRISLLERLRQPGEELAWRRFVELYTPLLFHWAGKVGAGPDDAGDLVQDVLAILVRELPTFDYRPNRRFRAWLWTVLRNKWRERLRRGEPAAPLPPDVPDPSPPPNDLEEAEYRSYIVNRALQLMKTGFEPQTWQACWECVVEGRPTAEVAVRLGMTTAAVLQAKSRVLRRLRQELSGLLD